MCFNSFFNLKSAFWDLVDLLSKIHTAAAAACDVWEGRAASCQAYMGQRNCLQNSLQIMLQVTTGGTADGNPESVRTKQAATDICSEFYCSFK